MKYTVISCDNLKQVRGTLDIKKKYQIIDENNNQYCAIYWNGLNNEPIVYDSEFDSIAMSGQGWSKNQSGYAYNHEQYMHKLVADHFGISKPGYTIDHINCCKFDNRKKNLRPASQSEQNCNRPSRSDKLPPPKELIDIGITELPRHVRWDSSEQKFIIEKHPYLLEEVRKGTRSKACVSGTKSKATSILGKYQDILARIAVMNEAMMSSDEIEFKRLKKENYDEYQAIARCIMEYEGLIEEDEQTETPTNADSIPTIAPSRRTAEGRKTIITFPANSGLTPADLPKYCHYKAAKDNRGDKFIIERHPALIKMKKRQWATTEKIKHSTHEKYNMMMAKLEELNALLANEPNGTVV
jgi:hypothetical protein